MKKLKVLFMNLVLVMCMLGSSTSASASTYSSGKAIIPFFHENPNYWTGYYVSNITDNPINVTVKFYDSNGTLVTDDGSSTTGRITVASGGYLAPLNYNDHNADSTVTFTINAHCTAYFKMDLTTDTYVGYGDIQWQQNGSITQGLVCTGISWLTNPDNPNFPDRLPIDINGGLPF